MAVVAEDGDNYGWVRAWEGEVGDCGACCAGRARGGVATVAVVIFRFGGCKVSWRTGAFCACVYREGAVAAGSAEGVARVPVEDGAGLGVDGSWGFER